MYTIISYYLYIVSTIENIEKTIIHKYCMFKKKKDNKYNN